MNNEEKILKLLRKANKPIKGEEIAKRIGISRQMVVQYIAKLRADGHEIVSTPRGYKLEKERGVLRKLIAVKHEEKDIYKELSSIVKAGGRVVDVIVDHPLYGEIRGMIDVESMDDVVRFVEQMKAAKAEPLLKLSGGVHIHTIEVPDEETFKKVLESIKDFLLVGGE